MKSLKEIFDLEEIISILIGLCVAGTFLMWFFFTTFPPWIPPWDPATVPHEGNPLYLSLAIVFTVEVPALFALLWYLKRKE